MLIDLSKAEKIHDLVYIYHNAFDDSLCDLLMSRAKSSDKYSSYIMPNVDTNVEILQDGGVSIEEGREALMALLNPGSDTLFSDLCLTHVHKNYCWGPHEDSMKGRDFNKEGRLFYAGVLYLNDFEGGEIDYPDINIRVKGKKGDLILHDANVWHFVNKVKTEDRYAMTFYIWKNHDDIYNKFVAQNGPVEDWYTKDKP